VQSKKKFRLQKMQTNYWKGVGAEKKEEVSNKKAVCCPTKGR
jgi:hypothetical protein